MTELLPLTPDELLSTTRAVRRRLDLSRPVPLTVIREALEVALQAPSGGNRQRWHWIVVTDPDLKAQVADYYRRSHLAYRQAGAEPADAAAARVATSSDYLREVLASAGGPGSIWTRCCTSTAGDYTRPAKPLIRPTLKGTS